jgi:hypothetical protein
MLWLNHWKLGRNTSTNGVIGRGFRLGEWTQEVSMRIQICAVLTVAALLAAPAAMADDRGPAAAYAPSGEYTAKFKEASVGMKIVDVALVRFPSAVLSLASTVLFIGTLPLTLPTGTTYDLATYMVNVPWRFTGFRPYGNFSEYKDRRTVEGWPICVEGAYGRADARGEPICRRWR